MLKTKLGRLARYIYQNKQIIILFAFIFSAFFINTLHTQFPDEFDNIYGGFLIDHGKLPYIGFFSHHNPGAYYIASIITLFSQRSFVLFRIIFSIFLFLFYIYSYYLLKKQTKAMSLNFFLFYGVLIAIGATFWWGQMLLSETVVGYLLVPVLLLIILKRISRIRFEKSDIIIISIFSFISLFTSLTYIYFIPMIYLVSLYYYFQDNKPHLWKDYIFPIGIIITPYLLFSFYLIITQSVREFYFDSIFYNVNYYIYNLPTVGNTISHNPIRYAISIAKHTIDNFSALLIQVKNFNFGFPLNVSLAIGDTALIIYFLMRREFILAILIISMIIYTNARSEPLGISETDFHSTVFIMITISLISYFLYALKDELNKKLSEFERLIYSFLFLLVSIFWLFSGIYLSNRFIDKVYGKYMGIAPLIYDRPQTAPTLNKLVGQNEYFWIGPFELQELLFIRGKIGSKYYWFLPADARDDKIKSEVRHDLLTNKPKVIIFKKWYSNFGVKPEDFNSTIVDILNQYYFQLADLRKEGLRFKVSVPNERDFNFEDDYYFANDRKNEIIQLLFDKQMIRKI